MNERNPMTDVEALVAALFPGHLFGHEGGPETCAERDRAAAAELGGE